MLWAFARTYLAWAEPVIWRHCNEPSKHKGQKVQRLKDERHA
jgi:hypothetical protein